MYARTERTDRLQNVYAFYIFYSINKETLWLPIRKDSRVLLVKCTVTKIYICIGGVIRHIDILRSSVQKSSFNESLRKWNIFFSCSRSVCVFRWVDDLHMVGRNRLGPPNIHQILENGYMGTKRLFSKTVHHNCGWSGCETICSLPRAALVISWPGSHSIPRMQCVSPTQRPEPHQCRFIFHSETTHSQPSRHLILRRNSPMWSPVTAPIP